MIRRQVAYTFSGIDTISHQVLVLHFSVAPTECILDRQRELLAFQDPKQESMVNDGPS